MCQLMRPQSHKVQLDMARVLRLPARGDASNDLPHHQARGRAHWKLVLEKKSRPALLGSKHRDPHRLCGGSDPSTGKRPRGVEKERPRRSARLEGISRLPKSSDDRKPEQTSLNPPAGKVPEGRVVCASIAPPVTLIVLN